jgi:O-antigen/teichoic acid export membrane protein
MGHDPVVVALLVGLVGLVGFSIALVDGALDARLPHPLHGFRVSTTVYLIVTLLGLVLILPLVVAILLDDPDYAAPIRAGWALAVVGACTLTWWVLRVRGRSVRPKALRLAGTVSLLVAVVLGFVTGLPHILSAAGKAW